MSYSDYGGYCWKNRKRFKKGEDGTLVGIIAPKNRPLERATGLKLDVLVNAYKKQGARYGSDEDESKVDFLTGHPHHAIVGGIEGLAIVGHKQQAIVVWNSKRLLCFPDYSKENYKLESEVNGEKEGYEYWIRKVKKKPFDITGAVAFRLLTPVGIEFLGVSGYGIGAHRWKTDDGKAFLYPGERKRGDWIWSSEAFEKDKKKYSITDNDTDKPIGYKKGVYWPTFNEWEKFVFSWADKCR